MIFITGDCHSDFTRLRKKIFSEQKSMTKEDYLIITGDFGGVWSKDAESKEEKNILDWLESRPFTVLFVCGNHENFDRLMAYPVEEWNGGKVHKIRPSVIHLMRGQVFELEGKTIFTFGGAKSHDISGGILELDDPNFRLKKRRLEREGELFRVNHLTWWKEELPSEEEMEEGHKNLERYDYKVDYIVTHCCSSSIQEIVGNGHYETDLLTDYLEEIRKNTEYKKWFFGHYHFCSNVTDKDILIYEQIIRIG